MQVENGYFNLDIASDRDTLIQQAFTNLAAGMPGWKPREGNLDVLLVEQFAEMASEAAQVAASVPLSIFSYYGSLLGITQNTGVSMSISATWTLASTTAVDVFFPAGTIAGVQYNGIYYQFSTDDDLTIYSGSSTGLVSMTAISSGVSYNSLPVGTYLQPFYYIANLSTIQIYAVTTAGVDAESTNTYLDRLANALTAYTPRPIVANDYAELAQQVTGVGRAVAYDNTTPLVNQLPVNDANPTAVGWSAVNGATVATTASGASVVPGTIYSNTLASGAPYSVAAGDTFLPLTTTVTTAGATYTTSSTTVSLTNSSSQFPTSGAGVGYVQNHDGTFTRFTYSGANTTQLNNVVFDSAGTYDSGARIAFFGITNFANGATLGSAIQISNTSFAESVFIKSISISGTTIGWISTPVKNTYTTSLAITYKTAAGATTGDISVTSNSANVIATVVSKLSTSTDSFVPVLVAKVVYKDNTTAYYYSDLGVTEDGSPPTVYSAAIAGLSPNSYTGTISDASIPASFARGISTISLTMYYPGAASPSTRYLTLASIKTTNKNIAYYNDGTWKTNNSLSAVNGNTNPANIIPDVLFESVYSEHVVTKLTANATVASDTSITVASTAGWPTSGVGVLSDGAKSAYFMYTSLTATTLTGITWSGTTGTYASTANVTSLNPLTAAQQWTVSSTSYGAVNPLSGYGVQFAPAATSLGGQVTIASDIFSLPVGTYFLDATIDATAIPVGTSGSLLPTVNIYDASTDAVLSTLKITATAGTKARNNSIPATVTISTNKNVYALINFPSGMPISAAGRSVVVTNMQLFPVIGSIAHLLTDVSPNPIQAIDSLGPATSGPSWSPGGYSAWNSASGNASANSPRSVMVAITDPIGMRPTSTLMQSVENYLNSYREINFDVSVVGPTYQIVDIIYSVNAAKGYDPGTVQAEILSNLEQYLSPTAWAGGLASPSNWDNTQNAINYLDVVGRIDDADGVANVTGLQIGLRPQTGSTTYITSGSLALNSLACLPIIGKVSATINSSNSSVLEVN